MEDVLRNPISTSRLVPDSRLMMLEEGKRFSCNSDRAATTGLQAEGARDVIGRVNYWDHVVLKRETGLPALLPCTHWKRSSMASLPQEHAAHANAVYFLH